MASQYSVTLDMKKMEQIARDLNKNTEQVLKSFAFQVEGEAKTRAPVDTGALKNSINTKKMSDNLYRVQDGVEYGLFQELGTSRMAAHPFMKPAVEAVRKFIHKKWGGLFK